MEGVKTNLRRKLAAYSLAAGAAGFAGSVNAGLLHYDNGYAGWFDDRPPFGAEGHATYDQIVFGLDGTVLVDDAEIDPALPVSGSIELMGEYYNGEYVWGDGKTRDSAFLRVNNAGVVGGYWAGAAEAGQLAVGTEIGAGSTFVTGDAEGDIGLYGYGWYSIVGGFSGRGFLGFYIDDASFNRFYGWADISVRSDRAAFTLHSFAISDVSGRRVLAGVTEPPEPTTLSLLAIGAIGLLRCRKSPIRCGGS